MCQHMFGLICNDDLVQFYRMTGSVKIDEHPFFGALYPTSQGRTGVN